MVLGLLFAFFFQGQALTSFEILGTVRDVKGQAVSNVRISIQDENYQPLYTAFVDSSGRFTKRVRTGRYIIRIETTGTPYEEHQTGWIELSSLRKVGGASEVYPIDFTLKFRKGEAPPGTTTTVFAQDVPRPALKEYEKATKELKNSKSDQAIAALKKAVEIFPDYYDALEALGIEDVKTGRYDDAIPLLTHAVQINKRSPRCMYGLGVAYLKLNRLQEAVEWLEKSSQLEPNSANTQMMLGLAYGTGGALDKSEAALKKALQIGGMAAAEAHFYLAGLYNKQEKFGDARQELEAYLKDAKNLKDPAQVKAMIENLKQKETFKASIASLPAQPQNTISSVVEPAVPANTTDATPTRPEPKSPTFAPVPPLAAEYLELLQQSEKRGGAMHRKLFDYTYQLKKTKRTLNANGKSTATEEQIFEAYPVRGEHILIRLSTNGLAAKNVADERKRAVKELEDAERNPKSATQPGAEGYIAAGIVGIFQGKPSYVSIDVTTVLKACEFFSPRTETVNNRLTTILNFRPHAGMNLAPKHAYLAKIVGTIWIDTEDKAVIKMEGWPASKAAFDFIQSTAPRSEASLIYQQERQPNGIWFPTLIRLNADGNFDLFDGLNWEVVFEFSKYQKFQTSADDLIVNPSDKKP